MISNTSPHQKIFGLDAMRVGAILLVLAAHCLWIFEGSENFMYKAISFSGFMGVEFFFVLSGFLVGDGLYKLFTSGEFKFGELKQFMIKRTLRIVPIYYLAIVLNLIVAGFIGWKAPEVWKYFFFLQNFNQPMRPFFPESWSMAIKEIPYLILPFILLLVGAIFRGIRPWFLFFLTTLFFYFLGLYFKLDFHHKFGNSISVGEWNIGMRSVLMYRFDSVLLGILMLIIYKKLPDFWREFRWVFLIIGLLIFVLMSFLTGIQKWTLADHPFFWNVILLPCLSLSAALTLPFFSNWKRTTPILEKPVIFLGKISYAIYVLHYSLILWPLKVLFPTNELSIYGKFGFVIVYLGITMMISILVYRFIEKPILNFRKTLGS